MMGGTSIDYILYVLSLLLFFIIIWCIYRKTRRITDIRNVPKNSKMSGIVTSVSDGDGFNFFHVPWLRSSKFDPADVTLRVRLAGIDAPEMGYFHKPAQPLSKESKEYLKKLVWKTNVCLEIITTDQYRRLLAFVYIRRWLCFKVNINLEMVKSGLACVYTGSDAVYGDYKDELVSLQNEAKRNKKGMWGLHNMTLPMDFKKKTRA